jgi:hypothetical protein
MLYTGKLLYQWQSSNMRGGACLPLHLAVDYATTGRLRTRERQGGMENGTAAPIASSLENPSDEHMLRTLGLMGRDEMRALHLMVLTNGIDTRGTS